MKHLSLCKWTEKTKYNTNTHLQLFCPNFPSIRKIGNSILFTLILLGFTEVCWGQADGDFQSKNSTGTSNTWGSYSSWNIYNTNGPGWKPAITNQTPTYGTSVYIQSGHTIVLGASGNANNLTISGSGKITCTGDNTLTVYGNIMNNSTSTGFNFTAGEITFSGSSHTFSGSPGGSSNNVFFNFTIPQGVTVSITPNIQIGGLLKVDGILIPDPSTIIAAKFTSQIINGEGILQVTRCISTGTTDDDGNFLNQYPRFSGRNVKIIQYVGSSAQKISPGTYSEVLSINNPTTCTLYADAKCVSANINLGKLIVAPGGLFTVTGNTDLSSAECLILQSDDTPSTGYFIHSDLFSGVGTIKVERFMSHSPNWHLYSSPIGYTNTSKNAQISIHDFLKYNAEIPDLVDQIDGKVLGVGMRKYITSDDNWDSYLKYGETDDGYMDIAKGFSIRTIVDGYDPITHETIPGSGTIDAIGIPNKNDVLSVSLTYDVANSTDRGWNCIGNPFTTGLNIVKFTRDSHNFANIDPNFCAVYIWDTNAIADTLANNSLAPSYIPINGGSSITNIQMGQGFFVKAKPGGGSVDFAATMQYTEAPLSFKGAQIQLPSIKIFAKNKILSSFTQIKFIANTTKGLDPGYDAGMLKSNTDFALYSRLLIDNGVDFTLQCLPDQNYDQYVIPLGIDCKVAGDITFTAETVNLPSGCQALLEDRLTKRFTRLDLKDAKYTAAVSADTKGIGRFYLHTSDVISSTQPIENQLFKVYETGKTVYINGEVSENAKFFIYSVNGKQLANFNATSLVQNQFDASGLPAGVYILSINDKNQSKSVKFVIQN